MKHTFSSNKINQLVSYAWKDEKWYSMEAATKPTSKVILQNSEEEFITEHFWGYTKVNTNTTYEYEVAHPRWQIYDVLTYHIAVDFGKAYGKDFEFLNHLTPKSVFLAEGSEIEVKTWKKI